MRLALLTIALVAFGIFSVEVVIAHGYTGFLSLAAREPWAMQMLIDLTICVVLASGWMLGDARKRGLNALPYVIAAVPTGSIAVLAYLIRREMVRAKESRLGQEALRTGA